MMRRRAFFGLALGLVVVGCSRGEAAVDPVWGKEPCAHCRMLVSDKRYAAQVVDAEGERRFFDDAGCMVLWMDTHAPPLHAWARDAVSGAWLEARAATYVQGARTPMDFGFEARAGEGIGFEGVRDAVRAQRKRSNR
jgi:copper chaperone NosL